MPIATPEPRLPLEPEEYPVYKPPRRLGCSGLSIVTLLTLFLFAFLFLRVTPRIVDSFKSTVSTQFNASPFNTLDSGSGTPIATLSAEELATQAAAPPLPTDTPVPPPPSPTPSTRCVQVINSALILRPEANTSARGTRIPISATLQLLEPGTPPVKDKDGNTWRHVQTFPEEGSEAKTGFVLDNDKYLKPAPCP